jgi:hypothetical protein
MRSGEARIVWGNCELQVMVKKWSLVILGLLRERIQYVHISSTISHRFGVFDMLLYV